VLIKDHISRYTNFCFWCTYRQDTLHFVCYNLFKYEGDANCWHWQPGPVDSTLSIVDTDSQALFTVHRLLLTLTARPCWQYTIVDTDSQALLTVHCLLLTLTVRPCWQYTVYCWHWQPGPVDSTLSIVDTDSQALLTVHCLLLTPTARPCWQYTV